MQNILETDREVLAAEGMHEGMHRYGTRYADFLPFMDKLTNLLFNAAEDVTIENWAGYRVGGAPKYLEIKNRIMDSPEWLKDHFGEDIPEHIKFIFGILYYGKHGELSDVLKGNARNELEKDEVKQPLDEVFNAIPKLRDENGNISVNTEPTPMEITAAAKKRVEIMRDKILPVYKKLLAERVEQLKNQQEGQDENGENVQGGEEGQNSGNQDNGGKGDNIGNEGREIDLDSLPEDIRKQLEKEIEKYAKELEDKTKEGSPDWQKAVQDREDQQRQGERRKEQEEANNLSRQRSEREKEGRRLSDAEKFMRQKALENNIRSSFNEYQLNLDQVRTLVHKLTGSMANILAEDSKPRWISGLRKGKDVDWDRFFFSAMSGYSDERYWRDRTVPARRSIKFTLVMDESGSMSGQRGKNAILAAVVFMDVLQNLGIDFNVRGFGDNTYLHKSFRDQSLAGIRKTYDTVKQRNELMEELAASMGSGGCTADGDALQAAVEDFRDYGADRNVILILSDGEGNEGVSVQEAIGNAESLGIKVIGIGIGEGIKYVARNYKSYVQIPDIEMLPVEFKQILKKEIESFSRASRNAYPLSVPADSRERYERKYGRNKTLADIDTNGFNIPYFESLLIRSCEKLQQILNMLASTFGRAPPELSSWRLVISTDLSLTEGNVASCNINTKTVYLHPYFFEISPEDLAKEGLTLEQLQLKILYHELISHIAKGIRDEAAAMEDTELFIYGSICNGQDTPRLFSRDDILIQRFFTFKELMAEAMYNHIWGFYSSGRVKFGGRDCDFDTWPIGLSPAFGDMVAENIFLMWEGMLKAGSVEEGDVFVIFEFGAGEATLAFDILAYTRGMAVKDERWGIFYRHLKYIIGERAPALRRVQLEKTSEFYGKVSVCDIDARNISGSGDFIPAGIKGVILSNELVDEMEAQKVRFLPDGTAEASVILPWVKNSVLRRVLPRAQADRIASSQRELLEGAGIEPRDWKSYLGKNEFIKIKNMLAGKNEIKLERHFDNSVHYREIFIPAAQIPELKWFLDENSARIMQVIEDSDIPVVAYINTGASAY
ncbi:MAG: SAM-dependent methyltransferase, partial [Candidatus Omnitrophica bacterium]|nr:SAM-dependent methyltransferase [Candidatus Omnitrophota bacterium]